MSRPIGSGATYQAALLTRKGELKLEHFSIDNLEAALAKIKEHLGSKSPQVSMIAAKFIIDNHVKYAKQHGKNPKPVDFIVDKEAVVEDGENNLISLEFKG